MTHLRLASKRAPWEREVRAILEARVQRRREAVALAAHRRKALKLAVFLAALCLLVLGLHAPYATLSAVALRLTQTATILAALYVIVLILKAAHGAAFDRPKGSTAGTEVPREK